MEGWPKLSRSVITTDSEFRAAISAKCDVTSWADQLALFQLAVTTFGDVDIVIPNAGIGEKGVVMFQRVDGGRNLTEVARNTDVPTRTSFVFI